MVNTLMLRTKMLEKGVTQRALSRIIGITEASMSRKINNSRKFTAEEIILIEKALEIKSISEYFVS